MEKAGLIEEIKTLRKELDKLRTAPDAGSAREELERLERIKSRFIEAVAHELRTPVTPLKSVVEMFLDGMLGEVTPEQRKYFEMMERNIERLSHFISEITTLSKLESGEITIRPKRISILAAVHAGVELLKKKARKKNIIVSLGTQTELFVHADPDAVSTVVSNLVDNAIVHNPEGTTVIIATRLTGRNYVEVTVSDNGKGIPPENLTSIFDSFSLIGREHGPGYTSPGIGLSVCKSLVEKMGGKISVESVPGEGTTFAFVLPITKNHAKVNSP
jgi:signal transduction histidine kinase